MITQKNRAIIRSIKRSNLNEPKNLLNLLEMAKIILAADPTEREYCFKISGFIKQKIPKLEPTPKNNAIYWLAVLFEAPYLFDSFCLYMEKNRPVQKRFYQPRRNTLKVVVDDLQDLEDGKLDFYGLSLPARVGKSTICIFFLAWTGGKRPNSHSAMGGHSGILAKGFQKEYLNLITSPEYTFSEIFPGVVVESKSAEDLTVNLGDPDRFATLTCRGIDGTWTGAVDISNDGYLYVDDLVRDRTESLSPVRLENRYQDYLNVMVDRKNDGSRELMVGTRWNVMDPLGKIEAEKKDNPRYRFRKIPALNEKGESNFNYMYGIGFSTEYYEDIRDRLDKNEWMAKYQQAPFVREGLVFPSDELNYYNGVLPSGGLVKIVAACDVAWGGGDSLSMPIGYVFEDGFTYIADWVFTKAGKEESIPRVCAKIMENQIQKINFEANNGGDMYAKYVSDRLEEYGYKCSVSSSRAPNTMAKTAKIEQYAGDIKRNFYFLSPKDAEPEYKKALEELSMFVSIGKNEHEDAADSLAQLESELEGGTYAKIEIPKIGRFF